MILNCTTEFRGKTEKITEKGVFRYVNLEDTNGESAKFQCDNNVNLDEFKKGDIVNVSFDFNYKYGSLKVVNIVGGKK